MELIGILLELVICAAVVGFPLVSSSEVNMPNVLDDFSQQLDNVAAEVLNEASVRRLGDPAAADYHRSYSPYTDGGINRHDVTFTDILERVPSLAGHEFSEIFDAVHIDTRYRQYLVVSGLLPGAPSDSRGGQTIIFTLSEAPRAAAADVTQQDIVYQNTIPVAGTLEHFSIDDSLYLVIAGELQPSTQSINIYHVVDSFDTHPVSADLVQSLTSEAEITDIGSFTNNGKYYLFVLTASEASYVYVLKTMAPEYIENGHFALDSVVSTADTSRDLDIFNINGEVFAFLINDAVGASALLRFDDGSESFVPHQEIAGYNAKQSRYIAPSKGLHLLFIADEKALRVFKWREFDLPAVFELYQIIPVADSNSIQNYQVVQTPGCEESTLLLLITFEEGGAQLETVLYSLSSVTGQQFQLSTSPDTSTISNSRIQVSFTRGSSILLLTLTQNGNSGGVMRVMEVVYSVQQLQDPYRTELENLQVEIDKLRREIAEHEAAIKEAQLRLEDAVVDSGGTAVLIDGKKIFTNTFTTDQPATVNLLKLGSEGITDIPNSAADSWSDLTSLLTRVGDTSSDIDAIRDQLENVVDLNEGTFDVQGLKSFEGTIIVPDGSVFTTNNLQAATMEGMDLGYMFENAVRANSADGVGGAKTFTQLLPVETLVVDGSLNGLSIWEDLVRRDVTQDITGSITISGNVSSGGDIVVDTNTNGIDISTELVQLNGGDYTLSGESYRFLDEVTFGADLQLQSTYDGVDLCRLLPLVLRKSKDQEISGEYSLSEDVLIQSDVALSGTLNDVDVSGLDVRCVKYNEPAVIVGAKHLDNTLRVSGDLTVSGLVDNTDTQNLITRHGPQTITAAKGVNQLEVVGDVTVREGVNGVIMRDELITLTGDDRGIEGSLSFTSGLQVDGNLLLSDTTPIDGVLLSEFSERRVSLDGDQGQISGDIQVTGPVTINQLTAGTIQGDNIDQLLGELIFLDDLPGTTVVVSSNKNFAGLSSSGGLTIAGALNGQQFPADYVSITAGSAPVTIQDHLEFTSPVTFSSVTLDGLVDGVNLPQLLGVTIPLHENVDITGVKVFIDKLEVREGISLSGVFNDIDISADVMTTNTPQTIDAALDIETINVENTLTAVNGITVRGTVNDWNLAEFESLRYTLDGDQIISSDMTFNDLVILDDDLRIEGTLNDEDIHQLTSDLLYLSSSVTQVITGVWRFAGLRVNANIDVLDGKINGMDLVHITEDAVRLSGDNIMTGNMVFTDPVTSDGPVTVSGPVNDVDLEFLNDDLVRRDSRNVMQEITAAKSFKEGFTVQGSMGVSTTVNGVSLETDLLMRSGTNVVEARYNFNTINVNGDVDMSADVRINQANIVEISENALRTVGSNVVQVDKEFMSDIIIARDTSVSGTISGVDLPSMMSDTVPLSDDLPLPGFTLSGRLTSEGNIDLPPTGNVNGRRLSDFVRELIFVDESVVFESMKTLRGDIVIENTLHVDNGLDVDGTVGGKPLEDMINMAFYLDGDQDVFGQFTYEGTVEFTQPLILDGSLRGVDLENDLLLKWECGSAGTEASVTEFHSPLSPRGADGSGDDVSGDFSGSGEEDIGSGGVGEEVLEMSVVDGVIRSPPDLTAQSTPLGAPTRQIITARYLVPSINALSNIITEESINGLLLPDVLQDTLLRGQPLVNRETVTLTGGNVVISGNVYVNGLLNEIRTQDVVTIDVDATFNGDVVLSSQQGVTINGDVVAGSVNEKDIGTLCRSAFYLNSQGPLEISGDFTFDEFTSITSPAQLQGSLNNIDLGKMEDSYTGLVQSFTSQISQLEDETVDRCEKLNELHRVLELSQYTLDYFVHEFELRLNRLNSLHVFDIDGANYMIEASGVPFGMCTDSKLFAWNPDISEFVLRGSIESGLAKFHHTIRTQSDLFLILIDYLPGYCQNMGNAVFVYDATEGAFTKLQDLPGGYYFDVDSIVLPGGGDVFFVLTGSWTTSSKLFRYTDGQFQVVPGAVFGENTRSGAVRLFQSVFDDEVYVAFSNRRSGFYTESVIYSLDETSSEVTVYQEFYLDSTSDVEYFALDELECVVFVVNQVPVVDAMSYLAVKILCRTVDDPQFTPHQTLVFTDGKDVPETVELFTTGYPDQLYLAVTFGYSSVSLYQYKYASGFAFMQSIPRAGITRLQHFKQGDALHLVAAVSKLDKMAVAITYQAKMSGVKVEAVEKECD